MVASTPRRLPRPAVALLAVSLLIGWSELAPVHLPHKALSPPLDDEQTHKAVEEVANQAQLEQDDPSVRLMPHPPAGPDNLEICCLHANILDFYLLNVLSHHSTDNQHTRRLRSDLSRISHDLEAHGCNITRYHDHQHAVKFRQRYFEHGQHRRTKALGEVDILFYYLQDYC
uniref:Interleukin 22 n=2 Tax=Tetraodon nigroviridis TaxID=99883 RepID=H3CLX2_TETNG